MRNRATLRFHCYTLEEVSSNRACRSNTFFVPSRFNPLYSSLISPFFFPFLVSFIARRSDFRHCCSTFSRIFYPPSSYLVSSFCFVSLPLPFHPTRIAHRGDRVDRLLFLLTTFSLIGTTFLFSRNIYLLCISFLVRNLWYRNNCAQIICFGPSSFSPPYRSIYLEGELRVSNRYCELYTGASFSICKR